MTEQSECPPEYERRTICESRKECKRHEVDLGMRGAGSHFGGAVGVVLSDRPIQQFGASLQILMISEFTQLTTMPNK